MELAVIQSSVSLALVWKGLWGARPWAQNAGQVSLPGVGVFGGSCRAGRMFPTPGSTKP